VHLRQKCRLALSLRFASDMKGEASPSEITQRYQGCVGFRRASTQPTASASTRADQGRIAMRPYQRFPVQVGASATNNGITDLPRTTHRPSRSGGFGGSLGPPKSGVRGKAPSQVSQRSQKSPPYPSLCKKQPTYNKQSLSQ
jgi:hypothetical protein